MKFLFWNVVFILMVYPVFAGDYFVLGGGEGVAEIIAPRQIEEGPDGNIYIYDEGAVFIKVFSKEGAYLRQMGGKGPGPGEILRAGNLHFNFTPDGKRLYFSEFFEGHRWLTFMNLSGSYSDVLKLKMTKVYGILATLPLRDGFLAQVSFSGEVERKREYYLYNEVAALVKLTPEGRISPPILEQKYVGGISRLPDGGEVRIPFKPKFLWVYLDGQIILSDGVSPVLQRYDMSGKLLGEIKTFLPAPQPVMAADLDEWKKNKKRQIKNKNWFNRFGSIIYKYDISIYDKKPMIHSLALTPDKKLLLAARDKAGTQQLLFRHLYMSSGKRTDIRSGGSYIKITKNFLFLLYENEDDEPLILCLKRRAGEAEDLKRLLNLEITKTDN